jgi:TetR/AcrR family transcriptional regulator
MPTTRPHSPRWRRRPEVRPHQILDAAFRVFSDRGLHRATLDDVAKAAGITKGTIYLYFPGKAALFAAMLKARVSALMPPVETPRNGRRAPSAREILDQVGREMYRFFKSAAYLAVFRTVVSEAAQFPEAAALLYRDGVLAANRRLAVVIEYGIATGEFRRVDPLVTARAFVGMFQIFAVSQELLGGRRILPLSDERIVGTVTDLFFRGLLAVRRSARAVSSPRKAPSLARRLRGAS